MAAFVRRYKETRKNLVAGSSIATKEPSAGQVTPASCDHFSPRYVHVAKVARAVYHTCLQDLVVSEERLYWVVCCTRLCSSFRRTQSTLHVIHGLKLQQLCVSMFPWFVAVGTEFDPLGRDSCTLSGCRPSYLRRLQTFSQKFLRPEIS